MMSRQFPLAFLILASATAGCTPASSSPAQAEIVGSTPTPAAPRLSTAADAQQPTPVPIPTCPSPTATGCLLTTPEGGSREFDWSHGNCTGSGPRRLVAAPMNPNDVGLILPLGVMVGGHVTPIDHQYYQPTVFQSPPDTYEVYSALDGFIVTVGVEHELVNPPDKITVVIEGSCTFWVWYNLLTSLTPELAEQALPGPGQSSAVRIPVAAGQLLGYIGGRTLDFAVVNSEVTLTGFLVPEHYAGEAWKIHVVDPFGYFDEPLRSQLLALDVRAAEPRGGRIDYDIDGRLIGNWFVEGTNGYAGFFPDQPRPLDYSSGHLAIVPDAIDPTTYTISIGSLLPDQNNQFGILGNAPDPAQVSVETGLVVYELVQINWVDGTGQFWDRLHFAAGVHRSDGSQVRGTVLMQLLADRRLQVEAFMGKRADQVTGFTNAALVYER